MKTLGFLFVALILFVFSPVGDWVTNNTPEWVCAVILCVGFPAGFYGLLKLLFTYAGRHPDND